MEDRKEIFKSVILKISEALKKSEDLVGSQLIEEFIKSANSDFNKIDEISNQDRNLKIGIVGEVKAGKSSFLNALIFDGENYLPKAATPMTAALTKIGYSDNAYAIIHFYSQEDWSGVLAEEQKFRDVVNNKLKELEAEYNKQQNNMKPGQSQVFAKQSPPNFASAMSKCKHQGKITQAMEDCYKLVKMASDSGLNLYDCLGKTIRIDKNVEKELFNYIGANGEYASIVKYAEIYLANPLLKGLEIIDTPGLNDPISSRSRKTKEFIVECDVVFLLSYLGQFMGAEDIGFLNREISSANIKEAFIVGSKLDSGILDYHGEKNCTIFNAFEASKAGYMYEGKKAIKEQAALPYSAEVFKVLNEKCLLGKEVIYLTSSLMYGAAKALSNGKDYSAEQSNIISQMKKRFKGFEESPGFMFALAGIHKLKLDVLEATKIRKEEIIENRIREFVSVRIAMYLKQLDLINEDLSYRLKLLETADAQELRNKINLISKNLDRSRRKIRAIFEIAETDLVNHMKAIRVKIKGEVENFIALSSSVVIEQRERTLRSGLFGCWRKTILEDVKNPIANVSDATANIIGFVAACDKLILDESTKIFEITTIKKQLKEAVLGVFDTSDDNFDEEDILIPVDSTLAKMQDVDIKVSIKDYAAKLEKDFPCSCVKGHSEVAKLEQALTKTLIDASDEYGDNLTDKTNEVKIDVINYSTSFIDEIKSKAVKNLEMVEMQLANKEAFIQKSQNLAQYVISAKDQLRKI